MKINSPATAAMNAITAKVIDVRNVNTPSSLVEGYPLNSRAKAHIVGGQVGSKADIPAVTFNSYFRTMCFMAAGRFAFTCSMSGNFHVFSRNGFSGP
jgi:hypothetical protein